MKALKAFRYHTSSDMENPVQLAPLYTSVFDNNPNTISFPGERQTYVQDAPEDDPNRVGFSTAVLRNKDAYAIMEQILYDLAARAHSNGGDIYEVEVEDEQDVPLEYRDNEGEKVFKTITPIKPIDIAKIGITPLRNEQRDIYHKLRRGIDDMSYFKSPYSHAIPKHKYERNMAEYAKRLEEATDDAEKARIQEWIDRETAAWQNQQRLYDELKNGRMTGYRYLRNKGYTIGDIDEALKYARFTKGNLEAKTRKERQLSNLERMMISEPDTWKKIEQLIADLEADPEMISDRNLKKISDERLKVTDTSTEENRLLALANSMKTQVPLGAIRQYLYNNCPIENEDDKNAVVGHVMYRLMNTESGHSSGAKGVAHNPFKQTKSIAAALQSLRG